MLEETKDTITVPAAFMIRMVRHRLTDEWHTCLESVYLAQMSHYSFRVYPTFADLDEVLNPTILLLNLITITHLPQLVKGMTIFQIIRISHQFAITIDLSYICIIIDFMVIFNMLSL